jgi:uncharacterized membrane protein
LSERRDLGAQVAQTHTMDSIRSQGRSYLYYIGLAFAILLPLACTISSYYDARSLLLLLYLLLSVSVLIAVLRVEKTDDVTFTILIGSITLSLLFSLSLVSNNLFGWDVHGEYYLFQHVLNSARWNPQQDLQYNPAKYTPLQYDSSLSISVLPTILSIVSGLTGIQIFKFILPAIFSLLPIVLYKTYRKFLAPRDAFLSVFLFMSYFPFFSELIALGRQEVAELLLGLLLLLFFSQGMEQKTAGRVLVVVLVVGVVFAHYSILYILVALLAFSYLMARMLRRTEQLSTLTTLAILITVALSWYLFVGGGITIAKLVSFLLLTLKSASNLFNPSTRPLALMQALGLAPTIGGVLHEINRVTQYMVAFALIFGFVIFTHAKKSVAEKKIHSLMTGAAVILVSLFAVPYLGAALNFERWFHVVLIFMAPSIGYLTSRALRSLPGVRFVSTNMSLRRFVRTFTSKRVLVALMLVSYFLFQTGWAWAVSLDRPTSLVLDRQRIRDSNDSTIRIVYFDAIVVPSDAAGAMWLKTNVAGNVCSDYTSGVHVLTSYGSLLETSQLPDDCRFSKSFIYLSELNVDYQIGTSFPHTIWPISNISLALARENRIYSNGGSTIYSPHVES